MIVRMMVLCLAVSTAAAAADSRQDAQLAAARTTVDIRAKDEKPFQLEISFHAQTEGAQEGHLILKWIASDRWRQQVTLGDFREEQVRKGDTLYTLRNVPFTPLPVSDLVGMLEVVPIGTEELQVEKVSHRSQEAGTECRKVRTRGRHGFNPWKEICFHSGTLEVLSYEQKDGGDRLREFGEYQPFRSHRYPRQFQLKVKGKLLLQARLLSLQDATFEDSSFEPPTGAVARRQCSNVVYPVPLKQPDPDYPKSAQHRQEATVAVAITVLTDGSVDDVQLLGSAGKEMDQATQDTVKTWKFKPAMCGGEPIVYDLRVEVTFHP